MKVYFINRFFFPDHSATSQMLSDLAFYLASRGYAIHVITSRLRYDQPAARLVPYEHIKGVEIHRVWTSRFGRGHLIGRAFDYLSFYLAASIRLWRLVRRGDVVVAKTDPPLISVPAAWVARRRRAVLINWLQDIFPEVAQALGVHLPGGAYTLSRLIRLRDFSLRSAYVNVVLGERMAQRVDLLLGASQGREMFHNSENAIRSAEASSRPLTEVIPNWADGSAIRPLVASENPLRQAWNLEDKIVVGYSGNLGRAHVFNAVLKAGEHYKARDDLCFLWIGGGAQYQTLQNEATRRGLTNWIFKPYQPREDLAQSLGVADIHLISLAPKLEGLIVPSKFYGILAAGRPAVMIGDPQGEIATLLHRHECGYGVSPDDVEGLLQCLERLIGNPDLHQAMGQRARWLFETQFDQPLTMRRWEMMFSGLLPEPA